MSDSAKKVIPAERAELIRLYQELAAPFKDKRAIEETSGRLTGRGYDTTGIKYQFIVNRLNEVLGLGGFRVQREMTVKQTATAKGRPGYEAICDLALQLGEWVEGEFVVFAEALADGGHFSTSEADARKGAYTNGFKKAAAFFGVGRQAYEGTLDDDNTAQAQDGEEPSPFNEPKPEPKPAAAVRLVEKPRETPRETPRQEDEAERARALANAAEQAARDRIVLRDKEIFREAVAVGVQGYHGWAEKIIGRPYSNNSEWTEDDRCHLEEDLLARREKVAQMANRENLQNSPALRNGSGRPVPVKQP
jgi:hypothetical protein